jgi:5-methylcytosine-specific restriction endonuclease McrA
MDAKVRAAVHERAGERCEYCQRRQIDSPLIPLQIEHIVPRKHGGNDELDNLALACPDCNLHKGSNLTGIDPVTNEITSLFNPRNEVWRENFVWSGVRIEGTTAVGRTTVRVLDLNEPSRLRLRLATGAS